jgi:hypothetical protein
MRGPLVGRGQLGPWPWRKRALFKERSHQLFEEQPPSLKRRRSGRQKKQEDEDKRQGPHRGGLVGGASAVLREESVSAAQKVSVSLRKSLCLLEKSLCLFEDKFPCLKTNKRKRNKRRSRKGGVLIGAAWWAGPARS